jgi:tRNA pseudouridine13 synthase
MIGNPLPQEYATAAQGVGGRIKVRAEDFLVDEIPLYDLVGAGEHLYLGVRKTNTSHAEMISVLRRHFGVDQSAIGFAGMKDKVGVTQQSVSIYLPGSADSNLDADIPPIEHQRVQILWSTRHHNKLRLGQLAGNRFSIRIRDVDPMKAPLALKVLRELERGGVPNYFGEQRFGYRCNNHVLGAYVLLGEWRHACTFLLGQAGGGFQEYQRPRRALYDDGRYAEAAAQWTTADRNELMVCQRLAKGVRPRDALLAVGDTAVEFWISALQSAIFNRVLDDRIRAGRLATLSEGDIACKHENRSMFHVTAEALASGELSRRLANQEIAPTGPLWGPGMLTPSGDSLASETAALAAAGFTVEQFIGFKRVMEGQRRPLSVPLKNASVESGLDEHGEFIRLAFDLPRGSYATVVLREIMKNAAARDDAEAHE